MTAEQCVLAYAAAFEESYRDDDWTRLHQHFSPDATYEVQGGPFTCTLQGPEAIARGMKKSVDGLDRRFESRQIELTGGPTTHAEPEGDRVEIGWRATYRRSGAPPLSFAGRSTATVVDGRIARLVDTYSGAETEQVLAWVGEHGQDLDGRYI